jgi:hypothetical protein
LFESIHITNGPFITSSDPVRWPPCWLESSYLWGTQGFEEYLIKDTEEDNHAVDNVIPRKAEKLGINVSGNGEMFDNSSL